MVLCVRVNRQTTEASLLLDTLFRNSDSWKAVSSTSRKIVVLRFERPPRSVRERESLAIEAVMSAREMKEENADCKEIQTNRYEFSPREVDIFRPQMQKAVVFFDCPSFSPWACVGSFARHDCLVELETEGRDIR